MDTKKTKKTKPQTPKNPPKNQLQRDLKNCPSFAVGKKMKIDSVSAKEKARYGYRRFRIRMHAFCAKALQVYSRIT